MRPAAPRHAQERPKRRQAKPFRRRDRRKAQRANDAQQAMCEAEFLDTLRTELAEAMDAAGHDGEVSVIPDPKTIFTVRVRGLEGKEGHEEWMAKGLERAFASIGFDASELPFKVWIRPDGAAEGVQMTTPEGGAS